MTQETIDSIAGCSLGPAGEAAWTQLRRHAEWTEGFWLAFVFATSSIHAEELERRMAEELSRRGKQQHILRPESPDQLRDLLPTMLDPATAASDCIWVEAVRFDDIPRDKGLSWQTAWEWLLLRANERRERLRRTCAGGLVLVAPVDLKPRFRDAAPDLWSIRALVLELPLVEAPEVALESMAAMATQPSSSIDLDLATREVNRLSVEKPEAVPSRARALRRLAQALMDNDQATEAVARATEASDLLPQDHPDRALALVTLAEAKIAAGDLSSGMESMRAGIDSAEPAEDQAELAAALFQLGHRSYQAGYLERALHAWRESSKMYSRLAESRPGSFLAGLAKSLNNIGAVLDNLGRCEEALVYAQEGVENYRELVESRPDAFLPALAMSLNNLGTYLSKLELHEDALAANKEAAGIYRALVESRPHSFLQVLDATQKAVEIYRKLAPTRPDAFLPDLAMSLNNLGIRLSELGRREEALEAIQEAVEVYRKMAASHPDAFLPDLAKSLNNLSAMLDDLGRFEDAAHAAYEAVGLLAPLFERLPKAFAQQMSTTIGTYLHVSEKAGMEPDRELIEPIQETLTALNGEPTGLTGSGEGN
jgi:tetratricopeptide (TPR) repeat protein